VSRVTKGLDPATAAEQAEAHAEQIALQPVDEARAVTRPNDLGETYVELERTALEDEQPPLWSAEGLQASRDAAKEAAGLKPAASAAERLVTGHLPILAGGEDRHIRAHEALGSYRRRAPGARKWHYLAKTGLLVGDVTTLAGSFIWLGEEPILATVMAVSAAVATVTAGLSGAEVRDVRARARRARPAEDLSEAQREYAHLFEHPDKGWPFTKALCWVSGAVAGTIAASIFALRASLEDPLVGLVFGGIAAAIAAASWIESYLYADDIADLLDTTEKDYQRELARHETLAASAAWRASDEALVEADSITAEYASRGEAAASHLRSLRFGILRRNPQVVGHGLPTEPTAIGQTARRNGGAK
jgi:hypothetical protein